MTLGEVSGPSAILDSHRLVFGYELLFRSSLENYFSATPSPMSPAVSTADNFFLFGVDRLTPGCLAFINCNRHFLVRDYPLVLPKNASFLRFWRYASRCRSIAACRRFKQMRLSHRPRRLSRFARMAPSRRPGRLHQSGFARHIQRRTALGWFGRLPVRACVCWPKKSKPMRISWRTLAWGYSYFQGYFFSRPEICRRHDIPANKLSYLRVLQAANRPQIDWMK